MKTLFILMLLFLVGGLNVFAQTTETKDAPQMKLSAPTTPEREKFDPARDAAADLQSAIALATAENKRIILDVGGEWCGWCRLMDNYLIKNIELGKLRGENYIWVKINYSDENKNTEFLSKYPAIEGFPHLFVLDKDGSLLKSKDTSELEDGKSYNLQKFTDFLREYAPVKNAEAK